MIKRDIFITGTGTDVGKTFISALILKAMLSSGIKAAYFKAAMSGNSRDENNNLIPGDALYVKNVSGTEQPLESMCPYVYERAYSPHLASQIEGNPVEPDVVLEKFHELKREYDCVIVEGSGGILCPIRFDEHKELWLKDIITSLNLNCILIADAGLGTINAVGLTAEYMRHNGINLEGIIFNHFQPGNILHEDNLKMCEYITGKRIIACVKDNDSEITFREGEIKI